MTQKTAIIIGAGPAGLSAAWWLRKIGWRPIVIERAPDLRNAGHMIGLSGPGLEVSKRMGIEPQLQASACVINENIYRDRKGRELLRMRYREFLKDLPYIALRRTDLVRALSDALPDVTVRFGTTAEKITDHGSHVGVLLADGTQITGDLLIGADGLRSWVRREVFGPDDRYFKELGYRFATYDIEDTLNLGIDFLSYTEPGNIVEYYTLHDGRIAALHAWKTDETGIVSNGARWPMLLSVTRTNHPQVRQILDAAERDGISPLIDNLTLVEMPEWSKGRIVLLGDAAHCLTLISGQGAGMSIASAAMLADELEGKPIEDALRAHEQRLRPAISKLQQRSHKMGALFIPATKLSFHLRNFALRHMPRSWLGRYFINAVRSEILATANT